jgi:hypothetical protein
MSEENVELVRRAYEALGPYPGRVEESTYANWVAPDAEADLSAVYPSAEREMSPTHPTAGSGPMTPTAGRSPP